MELQVDSDLEEARKNPGNRLETDVKVYTVSFRRVSLKKMHRVAWTS